MSMPGKYRTDNPERDWEDYNRDERPVVGVCDQCGEDIHGGSDGEYGDEIFHYDNIMVHIDCLSAWSKQFIKEVE